MGAKREYTAIFSIGARLLGSFRGAMAAAQSRMRALQATAMIGRAVNLQVRFGIFSTLFAGVAAFGVGAIFRKIYSRGRTRPLAARRAADPEANGGPVRAE